MPRRESVPARFRYPTKEKRPSPEAQALFEEGESLWFGQSEGTTPDLTAAVKKYEAAAALGHAGAQNYLGLAYRHGSGVERDGKLKAWKPIEFTDQT